MDATTEAEIEAQIIEDAKEADAEFLINKSSRALPNVLRQPSSSLSRGAQQTMFLSLDYLG